MRLTVVSKHDVITPIPLLVGLGSPLAVLFAVRAVVVNAVNRMQGRWTRPHIGIKVCKAFYPAFANRNATTAIATVRPYLRVVATVFHLIPNAVLFRFSQSVQFIVAHMHSMHYRYTFG